MLKKLLLSALISTGAFAAHQLEVNLNDRELEGGLRLDLARMGQGMNNTYVGVHFLNGDNNNSTVTDINPLMEASFLVMRPVRGVPGLEFGMGVKGEYVRFDNTNFGAIPLGVEGELRLPVDFMLPVFVGGSLYYAPKALCFAKGESYYESRLHMDIEPIDDGRLEIGYRRIDTDVQNRNVTYNDAWYFGFKLAF
ncbi:MAG: YfaZ family outer membrane protein [Sulfuricurvum sp.]|nr:YfaZ family outer membrane protein [Sulfuricurvum sp.]